MYVCGYWSKSGLNLSYLILCDASRGPKIGANCISWVSSTILRTHAVDGLQQQGGPWRGGIDLVKWVTSEICVVITVTDMNFSLEIDACLTFLLNDYFDQSPRHLSLRIWCRIGTDRYRRSVTAEEVIFRLLVLHCSIVLVAHRSPCPMLYIHNCRHDVHQTHVGIKGSTSSIRAISEHCVIQYTA